MDKDLIARIVQAVVAQLAARNGDDARPAGGIPVEASARHVHMSQADFEMLFGSGQRMQKAGALSQPGQYRSAHRVRLIGPKGAIERVALLGPPRKNTQVEVSRTDALALGIKAPVRQSGDLANSADIHIQVDGKVLYAPSSTIVAARHIHMSPAEAAAFGVANGQMVDVLIEGARPLVLRDVLVRADDAGSLALHIDFDEANAAGVEGELYGRIISLDLGDLPAVKPRAAAISPAPQPKGERVLSGAAGKPALLTGRMVEEYAREGVQTVRIQGKALVTAQALDILRDKNIELLRS